MNILLIPATDWLRHPVPSRHHHIFEILTETDNVHVFQFDLYPERTLQRETNVIIHRPTTIVSRGFASYYALNFLSYSKGIAKIIKSEKIDVVVVSNLLPGIPSLFADLMGRKLVFDLKDMFSDISAIYYGNGILSSTIKGVSEWLLQRLLKNSDHIIAVSMFLNRYLKDMGISNVSLITNGADLNIFKPNLDVNSFNPHVQEKLGESKVIGLVATIDRWIDFETVLASLKEMSTSVDVKLLVVGGKMGTDYFDSIRLSVNRTDLQDRVIFTGVVPHKEVPYYVNLMDVCLIPMRQDLRLNLARCPDKLFEYLACGKPVVSTRVPEVLRIGKSAVKVYNDSSSLTDVLSKILFNDDLQTSMKEAGLNIAKDYDWRCIAAKYRRTLEYVIRNGKD